MLAKINITTYSSISKPKCSLKNFPDNENLTQKAPTFLKAKGPKKHTFWSRWCEEPILAMKGTSPSSVPGEPTTRGNLLWNFRWSLRRWYPVWRNHFFAFSSHKIIHVHRRWPAGILLPLTENIMGPDALAKRSPASSSRRGHDMSSLGRFDVLWLPTIKGQNNNGVGKLTQDNQSKEHQTGASFPPPFLSNCLSLLI